MSGALKLIFGFTLVALFQIGWHWFASTDGNVAQVLLKVYLSHNPHSHKGVAGYADFALPAMILGLLVGRIGWEWSTFRLSLAAALTGLAITLLTPIYAAVLNQKQLWWWPNTNSNFGVWFFGNCVMTIFIVAVFAYGGRGWAVYLRRNADSQSRMVKDPPCSRDPLRK